VYLAINIKGVWIMILGSRSVERDFTWFGQGKGLECVGKFCCLGDIIDAGGEAVEASRARVKSAWANFAQLAPVLTSRGATLKVKGKVYKACFQRVMAAKLGQ